MLILPKTALPLPCQQGPTFFSVPPTDAPELAHRGGYSVGVRTIELRNPGQRSKEIARLQQANAIQVAVEEDRLTDLRLTYAQYESVVTFGTPKPSYGGLFGTGTKDRTGRALVAELAPDEFLIGGLMHS